MNELEQELQQRIEQLEAGEPLEACLAGLPEQDAKALHLIAAMRALSIDDATEEDIAAQRADVLGAAVTRLNSGAAASLHSFAASFLAPLQGLLERLLAQREWAMGLAALLLIVVFGLAWRGLGPGPDVDDRQDVAAVAGNEETTTDPHVPPTAMEANERAAATGETASIPAVPQGPTVYLPALAVSLHLTAQTAAVENVQGVVEVQEAEDGAWTAVSRAATMAAGQRVRTGELSQATLTFYDGSQAYLGANTEISIDELNALRPDEGFRTVVMTQWVGDSDHSVQFRNDSGSRYEVKTPAGSGIARGTKFHVLVTPDALVRVIVNEGKVDVTGQNRTVSVTAGQLTSLVAGSVPDEPVFSISGEGEVTTMGAVWTIAGQPFQTHEHTLIIGAPQVGDLVRVDGHLLSDGRRMADRIVLLRPAVTDRFSLSGEVEAMGTPWTIAGQTILVNERTVMDEEIAVGDNVRVEGLILPGGSLLAQGITRLEEAPGLPFQFSGIVQTINAGGWTISGQVITVDEETAVDRDVAVGDVVAVRGWILEDGTWLATDIHRQTDDRPAFAFTGVVQGMDPWQVAGIGFETRPWTTIAPGINVGDRVRVQGSILSDGTWVATTITPLADVVPNTVRFVGVVASIDPWVVNGLPLVVTDETVIIGNITVGVPVVVQAQLLPDGTWTVLHIRPLSPDFGLGCLTLSSPVVAVHANAIQVQHWQGNIDLANVQGDVAVNHIVTLPICTDWDGTIIIIGDIIIIYQPTVIIIDDGGWSPPGGVPSGCKITGIGNNNPHLKCSNRGSGSKKS